MSKVGFFEHQKSGCYLYRIKHPMDALIANGIPTQLIHVNEDVDWDNITAFQKYGASPFSMERAFEIMKKEGKRIVYDSDDALKYIDPTNPFYTAVQRDIPSATEALAYADHVTASTEAMADYLRPQTKAPITVLPNVYVPNEWNYPRVPKEGFRIGFMGSGTHMSDLIPVLPAIKNIQTKYPQAKFLLAGFGISDYPQWFRDFRYSATEEGQKQLVIFDTLLSEIQFEWIPFVDYDIYPQVLINMALDIGVCPLNDTPFNRCRSALKAMEYTLSGALALASDIVPYNTEPTSVLVKDWETALTYFIENPSEMNIKRNAHLKWLQENRSVENESYIKLLKSVYTKGG